MKYLQLNPQSGQLGPYSLVPIRMEDREDIRQWRNEQMYHLRQNSPLSTEQQDLYFSTVVKGLFEEPNPSQYLFSYLHDGNCIGYGGLVHLDRERGSAELSFIMNTSFSYSNLAKIAQDALFSGITSPINCCRPARRASFSPI